MTYPNGVVHTYSYDQKNRLTNLAVNASSGPIESYAYTLDNAGHRTAVAELSGRTVNYGYDNIYRLTSEAVFADPSGNNGTINYTYDAVGNRTQQTSTNPAITSGGLGYDADDRLTTDSYDANGNTIGSGGLAYSYDFENHLIQQGGATFVYDGDGNRVEKIVGGVTTKYLVADVNPTGYPQVVNESFSGGTGARELSHAYVYGLDRISQYRSYYTGSTSLTQTSYYVYDGHGSVRALTDPSGNITDTYDYDAFGNLTHSSTTQSSPTPNEFLFAGEQYDSNLSLYYNRARYLNVTTGRFWTMDTYDGDPQSPLSLHKYLYDADDPADNLDRGGNQVDDLVGAAIDISLDALPNVILNTPLGHSAESAVASWLIGPDVVQKLKYAIPDAFEFGVYGQLGLNTRTPLGLTGAGGFQLLASPKTGKAALYSYVGAGVNFGTTASGGGFSGSVGVVFNCPQSFDYTNNFTEVTIPPKALGSAILTKIENELMQVSAVGFEGGIPTSYAELLAQITRVSVTEISLSKSITVFRGYGSPLVFGVSFNVNASGSYGESASHLGLTQSYYWQLFPGGSVPFE